jgi:hypothetical protein
VSQDAAFVVGAFLTAKVLTDVVEHVRCLFAGPPLIGPKPFHHMGIYLVEMALILYVAVWPAPSMALRLAVAFRLAELIGHKGIAALNHPMLELLVLVIVGRLWDQPAMLVATLQAAFVSVWLYAVVQKLCRGEFINGVFFYLYIARRPVWFLRPVSKLLGAPVARAPSVAGDFPSIDPQAMTFARRFSFLVMASESCIPLAALLMSGTPMAVVLMCVLALTVGMTSGIWSFMLTNLIAAALFIVPFDANALWRAMGDPFVATISLWLLLWPPLHLYIGRSLRISPDRLYGWGMFSAHMPAMAGINSAGDIVDLPRLVGRDPRTYLALTLFVGFGVCRIRWLRAYGSRMFFGTAFQQPIVGAVFRWYRLDGRRFINEYAVIDRDSDTLTCGRIDDQSDIERLTGIARRLAIARNGDREATAAVYQSPVAASARP